MFTKRAFEWFSNWKISSNNTSSWHIQLKGHFTLKHFSNFHNNVKLLSKTPCPFSRLYDALFCHNGSNWIAHKIIALCVYLPTIKLITNFANCEQQPSLKSVSEQHFFVCTVNSMKSNMKFYRIKVVSHCTFFY